MAMHSHGHHHHDHDHDHDDHDHAAGPNREGAPGELPFDAANQSLSDALRASFRILKGIMLVLVVLYLFSNVRTVAPHEQAVVLRLGRLLDRVHEAGLVPALPFPIDEVLALPTRKSNDLVIESHSFHREENEVGKPLSFIHRGADEGLNPSLDGALITADSGIVHVQWKVTYKIDSVKNFIQSMVTQRGKTSEALLPAEQLIRTLVETVGVQVAAEVTAEELIRTKVDYVRSELKRQVNLRLMALNTGIVLTLVEMHEPTPPLQIRDIFDETLRAENAKQRRIRDAEQERVRMLSEAAGAAYAKLIPVMEELDRSAADPQAAERVKTELTGLLEREVEGNAGKIIKDAGAYYAVVVGRIQSDLKLYEALLPEYERNPDLLRARLVERAKQTLFESPGVSKIFFPKGLMQRRVHIPLDPEESRIEEELRLQKKSFDPSKLRPEPLRIVGPEFD